MAILETNTENSINLKLQDDQIFTMKADFIRDGTMMTLQDHDRSLRAIRKDIHIPEISEKNSA